MDAEKVSYKDFDFIKIAGNSQEDKPPLLPRASGLYKDCMRQLALCTILNIPRQRYTDASLNMVFGIGSAVHDWLQNSVDMLGDHRMGFWKCRSCGSLTDFRKMPTISCKCGANISSFIYEEYPLELSKPYYITGHPDMFVETANNKIRVVEFKTINSNSYRTLLAPMIEHQWQIQTYMWAAKQAAFEMKVNIDDSTGYVIYISKLKESRDEPIKVFEVTKDKLILKQIFNKLKEYKNAVDKKKPPKRMESCEETGFQCYTARNCPVMHQCKNSS